MVKVGDKVTIENYGIEHEGVVTSVMKTIYWVSYKYNGQTRCVWRPLHPSPAIVEVPAT